MQQQMHRTLRSSSRPAAQATKRTSSPPATVPMLKWQPRFDDLQTIVAHALAWE
jgi:hypothetical protein